MKKGRNSIANQKYNTILILSNMDNRPDIFTLAHYFVVSLQKENSSYQDIAFGIRK